MTRRTAREMAQDRLATAERKTAAVGARIVRAGAELRAAELALREAEAAEEYAEWERCEGCQTMADPGLPCPTCRDLRTIRPA